jgi:imidazoleglycerol-phosphate dehydratase/histidinol-phosphatase
MSAGRVIFLSRDGTLNQDPAAHAPQDAAGVRLMPFLIPSLLDLKRAGFAFVIVDHQNGSGGARPAREAGDSAHEVTLELLRSQGIDFQTAPIRPEWLAANGVDGHRSFLIAAGEADLKFAKSLGVEGLKVSRQGETRESWPEIARHILGKGRRGQVHRVTKETDVAVEVDLSCEGPSRVATGLGFFDHMLEQIAKHGGFSLNIECRGDLHIDEHHTVEDCALALGKALREALGDKRGIGRYGFLLAMDEAEAQVALDLSGRPFFVWEAKFNRERIGDLPTELVPHFFRSLAETLGAALHIQVRGENTHHMIESCFKGVGRSLRQAIRLEGGELPSTKGRL